MTEPDAMRQAFILYNENKGGMYRNLSLRRF